MKNHYYKHGLKNHPLYKRYYHILSRCNNKNNKDFHHYGGRGIKCEWEKFIDFYNDMIVGFKQGLEIDRIDNNGNYCKENCRWATRKEQTNNTRRTTFVNYKDKKYSLHELADLSGIKPECLRGRLLSNVPEDNLLDKDNRFNKKINGIKRSDIAKKLGITTSALGYRLKRMSPELSISVKAAKNGGKFVPKMYNYNGQKYTLKQLSYKFNIKRDTLWSRLYRQKLSLKVALTKKI